MIALTVHFILNWDYAQFRLNIPVVFDAKLFSMLSLISVILVMYLPRINIRCECVIAVNYRYFFHPYIFVLWREPSSVL